MALYPCFQPASPQLPTPLPYKTWRCDQDSNLRGYNPLDFRFCRGVGWGVFFIIILNRHSFHPIPSPLPGHCWVKAKGEFCLIFVINYLYLSNYKQPRRLCLNVPHKYYGHLRENYDFLLLLSLPPPPPPPPPFSKNKTKQKLDWAGPKRRRNILSNGNNGMPTGTILFDLCDRSTHHFSATAPICFSKRNPWSDRFQVHFTCQNLLHSEHGLADNEKCQDSFNYSSDVHEPRGPF